MRTEWKQKSSILVEALDDLMKTKMVPAANSMLLRDLLKFHKVPTYLQAMTTEILDDKIIVQQNGETIELPCDTVVVSVGYNSGTALADAEKLPENVHLIGDAEHAANLMNAIWSANDLVISL